MTHISSKINAFLDSLNCKQTLIGVTKYSEVDVIKQAFDCHLYDYGENRLESLERKAKILEEKIGSSYRKVSWHFIGKIQGNKIKKLLEVKGLKYIHSLCSLKHLIEIEKYSTKEIHVFIQFNTSGEEKKGGLKDLKDFEKIGAWFKNHPHGHVKFAGLMTMAKAGDDPFLKEARCCFERLVELKKCLTQEGFQSLALSMGMSRDYEVALELGADYIRVGSKIFQ